MTLDEFNTRQDEILARLPEELRPAVSHMAYERGHAYGYQEVLIHLEDLVAGLEAPVRAYGDRRERLGRDWAGV
jgi:hypothetical protein